jgi:hypothetical protein
MQLTTYVDDLQRQLATAASAGGEQARELAQRLTASLDAAARLVLLNALSDAAGEITTELAPGSVDVRLRGHEPEFVVTAPALVAEDGGDGPTEPVVSASAPSAAIDGDDRATTRTTLRLPDELKARVEDAAAHDGVSVNTWLVRAVAAALEPPKSRRASREARNDRLTGWVR